MAFSVDETDGRREEGRANIATDGRRGCGAEEVEGTAGSSGCTLAGDEYDRFSVDEGPGEPEGSMKNDLVDHVWTLFSELELSASGL